MNTHNEHDLTEDNDTMRIIRQKLSIALDIEALIITDDSDKHKGHSGARVGGQSHFSVTCISKTFEGLTQMQCHRLIYRALEDEMKGQIHALSLKCQTPSSVRS